MKKVNTYFSNFIKIFTSIEWSMIEPGTIVRYVIAILVVINTFLNIFDINPIPYSEDNIYDIVSNALTIIILLVNTYKNNSTSPEAIAADIYMRALKSGASSIDFDEDEDIAEDEEEDDTVEE